MLFKSFKIKILIILAVSLFYVQLVSATGDTGSNIPELNPLCWKKNECLSVAGRSFSEVKSGPCETQKGGKPGEEWGRCSPAGAVETKVGIGGVKKFNTVGHYILTVYNYALKIAGIIGVAVIMVAGVQWLTSGGNKETITRAHKRIFGAIIGLIIAYASYFILANVNPALVDLRLPQVWMLKPMGSLPEMCSQLPEDKVLFKAAEATDQSSEVTKPLSKEKYTYKEAKTKFANDPKYKASGYLKWFPCGRRFLVEGGGLSTCFANTCQTPGTVCGNFGTGKNKYYCKKGNVVGTVTHSGGIWEQDKIFTNVRILSLCSKGDFGFYFGGVYKTDIKHRMNKSTFIIKIDDKTVKATQKFCNNNGQILIGYVLSLAMNQDTMVFPSSQNHYIGKDNKDIGDDNTFRIRIKSGGSWLFSWNTKYDPKYFFPPDYFKSGSIRRIQINADLIPYIEDASQSQTKYGKYFKK